MKMLSFTYPHIVHCIHVFLLLKTKEDTLKKVGYQTAGSH